MVYQFINTYCGMYYEALQLSCMYANTAISMDPPIKKEKIKKNI